MNKKVQVRLVPYGSGKYKSVQYRFDPSELNWFRRFFNPWRPIYEYIGDENVLNPYNFYYEMLVLPGTINEIKEKFKTIEDIKTFNKYNEMRLNNDLEIISKREDENNYIEY